METTSSKSSTRGITIKDHIILFYVMSVPSLLVFITLTGDVDSPFYSASIVALCVASLGNLYWMYRRDKRVGVAFKLPLHALSIVCLILTSVGLFFN